MASKNHIVPKLEVDGKSYDSHPWFCIQPESGSSSQQRLPKLAKSQRFDKYCENLSSSYWEIKVISNRAVHLSHKFEK